MSQPLRVIFVSKRVSPDRFSAQAYRTILSPQPSPKVSNKDIETQVELGVIGVRVLDVGLGVGETIEGEKVISG